MANNNVSDLGRRAATAAKWSVLTQVLSKLISPVTTMVLARLLTPEAFGVVATATMVISLADMFSDAGFQKYLIQHLFKNESELSLSACVAFWTNLLVSMVIVAAIAVANEPLAAAVGNPGLGMVLVVSSLSLPLTSLVSVQTALYQRKLDFKTLFGSRMGSSVLIFLVSVPLAFFGFDYWSLVFGTICSQVFLAFWLTVRSDWRPRLAYSVPLLKKMFRFGFWILAESALTWLNTWAGTFVLGILMDSHSVGLYKTSTTVCASVVGIFTAALMPVVFSSLSKLAGDESRFASVFFKTQRYLAICLVPIALGVFVYRHLFTLFFLGDQWFETELFIGLWLCASSVVVVFGYMCSEAYRAKGMPHLCVVVQALYLPPFLIGLWFSSVRGYECVQVVMPAVRLFLVVINLAVMRFSIGLSPLKMITSNRWTYLQAAIAVLPGALITALSDSVALGVVGVIASVLIYIVLLFAVPNTCSVAVNMLENLGLAKKLPSGFLKVLRDRQRVC